MEPFDAALAQEVAETTVLSGRVTLGVRIPWPLSTIRSILA